MSTDQYVIDLTAPRREVQYPHGIIVKFSDKLDLLFPAELPADALDPILSEELDLVGLLGDLVRAQDRSAVGEIIELLFRRPRLPKLFLDAVKATYAILLDEQQYADFLAARPSIPDYVRLTSGLVRAYGVDLGKLFASAASSESDGPTSKQTSPDFTSSTPEESGSAPDSADSSESVD